MKFFINLWRSEKDNTIKYQKFGYHMKPFGIAIAFQVKTSHLKIGAILFGTAIIIISYLIMRTKRKRREGEKGK